MEVVRVPVCILFLIHNFAHFVILPIYYKTLGAHAFVGRHHVLDVDEGV